MIRWIWAFIDRPLDRFDEAAAFWVAITGSALSPRRGEQHEFGTLIPASGDPYLKLQGVHDDGGVHLDFDVDDVPAAVATCTELGAMVVREHSDYTVLRSPAGQQFCITPWHGESRRPPVRAVPAGLVDQVCLDIGPSRFEAEAAFWTAVTGWKPSGDAGAEFQRLPSPGSLPLHFLLQRLHEDRPASAHLDLACTDVPAARVEHEAAGAQVVDVRPEWTVMRDPSGGLYCLTDRTP